MFWEQTVEYAALSDIGFRRKNNQDSSTVLIAPSEENWRRRGNLFMVADGMGGHAVGELASKMAVDTVPHSYLKSTDPNREDALRKAIEEAHAVIHNRGEQNRDFLDMGTTCSVLTLGPEGALIGHVGDSRVYRIRGDQIDQLSFDHSLQWELLRQGKYSEEEIRLHQPRNVITRCLGPEPTVQVDIEGPLPVFPGDVYLLCSDGLTGLVADPEIGMIARELRPADACRMLVNLANLRGGTDNITVIVVRIGAIPAGVADREPPEIVEHSWTDWSWLLAAWGCGMLLALAAMLFLLGRPVAGAVISVLFAVAAGGLGVHAWRAYRQHRLAQVDRTAHWKPHRSAPARLDPQFLSQLAALEHVLQQTAAEENWSIDWPTHARAFEQAKSALQSRNFTVALREFSNSIQILMTGIQMHRRRLSRVAKWGHRPSAESKSQTPVE